MMRLFTWRASIICRPLPELAHSMSNPGGFSRRKLILALLRSHRFSLKNVCPWSLWPSHCYPKYDLPMPSAFVSCDFIQESLLNNGLNCLYSQKPHNSKPSHCLDFGRSCAAKPRPPPVDPSFHSYSSPQQGISDLCSEHEKRPLWRPFSRSIGFRIVNSSGDSAQGSPHDQMHHPAQCLHEYSQGDL